MATGGREGHRLEVGVLEGTWHHAGMGELENEGLEVKGSKEVVMSVGAAEMSMSGQMGPLESNPVSGGSH